MTIKIIKLDKAFPGHGYDTHKKRARLFADAGIQHYKAAKKIIEGMRNLEWYYYVDLPLMHMALELSLKSVALYIDNNFNPKGYNHNTDKIINDYRGQVDLFDTFAHDAKAMELVNGLKRAWKALRYGEAQVVHSKDDWDLFEEMIKKLLVKFESISGIKIT